MSLDLSKLSPAPWFAQWQTNGNCNGHNLRSQDGLVGKFYNIDGAEAVALLRNALDIQMRRQWGTRVTMTGWNISNTLGMLPDDGGFNDWVMDQDWPDPATALNEAEKWYVANVLKGGAS